MKFQIILLVSCYAFYAESANVSDLEKTISTTIDFPPEVYLKQPGDWFALEYGKGDQLLRRELVDMTDAEDPKNPHYIVVGALNIEKNSKPNIYSYVGDENGIKVLGVKEIPDITKVDPLQYAQEFGWIRPENTFTYY